MITECRSSWYADTGVTQHPGEREVRCNLLAGHDGDHHELDTDETGRSWGVVNAWAPAKPGDTPGQLVPGEGVEPEPVDLAVPQPTPAPN